MHYFDCELLALHALGGGAHGPLRGRQRVRAARARRRRRRAVAANDGRPQRRRHGLLRPPGPRGTGDFCVGVVCRLTGWKRVHLAVEAAALSGTELVVVGDGEERGRLEALARDWGARVRFVGLPGRPAAVRRRVRRHPQHGRRASRSASRSSRRSSMARPVIAFATGGIPEIVENEVTGMLVSESDGRGLARGPRSSARGDRSSLRRWGSARGASSSSTAASSGCARDTPPSTRRCRGLMTTSSPARSTALPRPARGLARPPPGWRARRCACSRSRRSSAGARRSCRSFWRRGSVEASETDLYYLLAAYFVFAGSMLTGAFQDSAVVPVLIEVGVESARSIPGDRRRAPRAHAGHRRRGGGRDGRDRRGRRGLTASHSRGLALELVARDVRRDRWSLRSALSTSAS